MGLNIYASFDNCNCSCYIFGIAIDDPDDSHFTESRGGVTSFDFSERHASRCSHKGERVWVDSSIGQIWNMTHKKGLMMAWIYKHIIIYCQSLSLKLILSGLQFFETLTQLGGQFVNWNLLVFPVG